MAKLNPKQEAFCREYIIDMNATQAAIRAGYSEKTAKEQASTLLTKLNIQRRVAELLEQRNKRTDINADYVLKRLVEIDEMDIADILYDDGDIKPIKEWPKVWRTTLSGLDIQAMMSAEDTSTLIKKIKWPDKTKNLELLGKHVNVQAFREQIKNEHEVTTQTISDLMDDLTKDS